MPIYEKRENLAPQKFGAIYTVVATSPYNDIKIVCLYT